MNSISPATAERSHWIDIYRVLAMIIIVSGHLSGWSYITTNIASLACVNFFFFISGYFSQQRNLRQYGQKVLSFAFPYVFYNIGMLFMLQFSTSKAMHPIDHWQSWLNALIDPASFAMWFLAVLIILTLIAPLLHLLSSRLLGCICLILLAINLYLQISNSNAGYQPLLSISSFLFGMFCFVTGLWIRRLIPLYQLTALLHKHLKCLFLIVITLFLTFQLSQYFSDGDNKIILIYLSMISVPTLSIAIEKYLPRMGTRISKIAPSIFFIYVTHPFITRPWGKLYITLEEKGYSVISEILAQSGGIIIFCICYGTFRLLKRYQWLNYITMAKS